MYQIDKSGLINSVRQVQSENHDERPDVRDISVLVIHAISLPPDEFGGGHVDALFTNCLDPGAHPYFQDICQLKVSAHFLIERDGRITQFVPVYKRAWHAGLSSFEGREQVNDFSIGIELEGCDTKPFEEQQYSQLAALTHSIKNTFPEIMDSRIVGHSDIAPGRKTDPGPCFDWALYRQKLAEVESGTD